MEIFKDLVREGVIIGIVLIKPFFEIFEDFVWEVVTPMFFKGQAFIETFSVNCQLTDKYLFLVPNM